jgi:LysR family glycine cleavage system transcriptional activator
MILAIRQVHVDLLGVGGRGASRVALSPAALSERIRRLEDQLGERLFERTSRRVALTPAGLRLLAHVRDLLDGHARCAAIARGDPGQPLELHVGTRYELGLSWLVPALPALQRTVPTRRLHLHFSGHIDLLALIRQGIIDCAVTSGRIAEGAIDYRILHPENYLFVGSTALLRQRPLQKATDARAHTLLDIGPDLPLFRYFVDQIGGTVDWAFDRLEYLGTIAAVRLRVLQRAGVAVLPEYFVAEDVKRGRLRRLMTGVRLHQDSFRLVWSRGRRRSDALERLAADLSDMPLH